MLDATVGYDPLDAQTAESFRRIPDSYLAALRRLDVTGWRIGVLSDLFGDQPAHAPVNQQIQRVLRSLSEAGASIVRLTSPEIAMLRVDPLHFFVDNYDLRQDLTAYLQRFPGLTAQSFADLATDERLSSDVANLWEEILSSDYDSRNMYLEGHAKGHRIRTVLLTLHQAHDLDVMVYPTATSEAARLGEAHPHFNCKLASASGLPAIAVPAGFGRDDMPVAIELLAEPWAEQKLLDLAYTIEGLHPARRLPTSTP